MQLNLNKHWQKFDREFKSIFEEYDFNEESRQNFTKNTAQQFTRHIQNFFFKFKDSNNDQLKEVSYFPTLLLQKNCAPLSIPLLEAST